LWINHSCIWYFLTKISNTRVDKPQRRLSPLRLILFFGYVCNGLLYSAVILWVSLLCISVVTNIIVTSAIVTSAVVATAVVANAYRPRSHTSSITTRFISMVVIIIIIITYSDFIVPRRTYHVESTLLSLITLYTFN
jgi:hypothetical protein